MQATDVERRKALWIGVALLTAVHPRSETTGQVCIGPNLVAVRVYRDAAGVVRVVRRHDGELVAQSLPAQYECLDCTLLASARDGVAAEAFDFFLSTMDEVEVLEKVANFAGSPQAAGMTSAELAYVLREWMQRFEDASA